MTEESGKDFEMAVGNSNVLETGMMESETFYASMESAATTTTTGASAVVVDAAADATQVENPTTQTNWTGPKTDTGQLCRSCANSSDYLIPIYEGEGLEHQLEYKIQKHMPIQVSSTDTLPLQLCYQCASTLIAWDSMVTSCLEADKKLRAMQETADESKTSEMYEESQMVEGETEMVDSEDEPLIASKMKAASDAKGKATPIKKKILSKTKTRTLTSKTDKTATNSKDEEDKERSEPENRCGRGGNGSKGAGRRNFPKEMESISVLSASGALKSIYRCKLCGHKTNRSNNLKAHLQTHKRVLPYRCDTCGRRYQRRQDGKDHLTSIEIVLEPTETGTRKLYRCKLCGHASNRSNNLKKHLGSHGSTREFPCETCGGTCRPGDVVRYHVKEVEVVVTRDEGGKPRKSFRCRLCGDRYDKMTALRTHITTHKPINLLVCRDCGKEYLGEKSLREHLTSAHGRSVLPDLSEYPFRCEYCDQLFAEKATCDDHRRSHGGERPYVCSICGSAFRTQSSLYLHTKVHDGVESPPG